MMVFWNRATSSWPRRLAVAAAGWVVAGALAYAAGTWVSGARAGQIVNPVASLSVANLTNCSTTNSVLQGGATPACTATPTVTSVTAPTVIGGTGATSPLTLRSTSGVGAAGADIVFQTGNNGATEAMRVLNNGNIAIGASATVSLGVGTSSPASLLHVRKGAGAGANVSDSNAIVQLDSDSSATNVWFNTAASATNATFGFAKTGAIKSALIYNVVANSLGIDHVGSGSSASDLVVNSTGGVSIGTSLSIGPALSFTAAVPTISPGTFGTNPSVTMGTATAFRINVGTGGTATSGVVVMNATATNAWNCHVNNLTAAAGHRADNTRQTASTTTTVTVENQTTSTGAAVAWTASDVVTLNCTAL